jgi:hypothetical protein
LIANGHANSTAPGLALKMLRVVKKILVSAGVDGANS